MSAKLILENYIPLLSSGISRVELDLGQKVNLLISLNGVGKSNLLKELNPLPPENCNFRNGRKYYENKIGHNHYVLDSHTGSGGSHSFKLNGDELNEGGTFTVQKTLVSHHFGLDNGLVRVLNGLRITDRLSSMTPARRKDILMQIYPNDTEYALGVFNKLKTERNELKAAIKNQVTRYAEENRKLSLINEVGIEQLECQIKGIEGELKQALLLRGQLEGVNHDPELSVKVETFKKLTDQLTVNKVSGFLMTERELEDQLEIQQCLLSQYQEQAAVMQGIISENAAALEGLEEFLKDPDSYKQRSQQLADDLARNKVQVEQYNQVLSQYPIFVEGTGFDGLDRIIPEFIEYLNRVVPASSVEITGGNYRALQTKQEQLAAKAKELALSITELGHQLGHYDRADTVECPSCSHGFKVGISAADIAKLRQKKDVLTDHKAQLERQLEKVVKDLENDADWFNSMNQLFTFIRANQHVKVLLDLIKEFDVSNVGGAHLSNALKSFLGRAKIMGYSDTLNEEKALLEARIELLDRNNILDTAMYVSQWEKNLHEETEKIINCKAKISSLEYSLKMIRRHDEQVKQLGELHWEILDGMNRGAKVALRRDVDTAVHRLTTEKEDKLSSIIRSRSLNAVVESISADIDRLKRRLLIVETWMNGLCPNKGYLGKLMTEFISSICGNMNAIIKPIWNGPLFIKPCNKENGDLTYKFPVITGEEEPTPDVTDCSMGEADILDWAWRLVLLNYAKFPFPLIMDEVGVFFDEIKRGRFFNFVHEYTQRVDARPLFLVSHYIATNGQFDNPNIIALKYDGLTLPGEPNKHTLIN